MPIKKRSAVPAADAPALPLVIVAKPKKPLPPLGMTQIVKTQKDALTFGLLAQQCGDSPPDTALNVADRVKLMRTVWDKDNPQEARYRNRVRGRATAITAMCICCAGTRKAVTECAATACPLWAFRFGGDPFRGKR